jgi:pimeloyl-ACP methyl ester carboxylesterase
MKTDTRILLAGIMAAAVATSCIPRHPSRTQRRDVPLEPWEERTSRSLESGHEYRYLFLPGPSPTSPAILLLHGGFFDSRMWLYSDALSEHFNVYALDWPDNSLFYEGQMADFGEAAYDFLQTVPVTDLYVAGVSAGAYSAIELVANHGDLDVKALFLFSAVMLAVNEDEVEVRGRIGRIALGMAPDRFRAFVEWNVERQDFDDPPGGVTQDGIFYVRPYTYYYQLFRATTNQGAARQQTDRIRCPTLVLQGTDDDVMPVEAVREGLGLFGDAELVEFDGYGHAMVFEHGPEMVAAMLEFLERRDLLP